MVKLRSIELEFELPTDIDEILAFKLRARMAIGTSRQLINGGRKMLTANHGADGSALERLNGPPASCNAI